MDWVFKTSSSCSWDLTELERDEFDVLDDIGKNQNMDVFSVDPSSSSMSMNKWNEQKHSTIPSFGSGSGSGSGSSKKSQDQNVSCLVDGCTADLRSCRDYHRRHRVCESHSKTPVVTIAGKEQRFCQQCSRFHSLGEFDEVKRSCRKRLDGHNRRRRKPRADSMYLNYERFFTNPQGTKLLRFGGSPAYTTTFGSPLTWPDKERFNQQLHVTIQPSTPTNSYARVFNARERKFPFLLCSDSDEVNQLARPKVSSQQDFSMNASTHLLGEFSERLTQLVEPKCALSLLSKHTIHTSESSLSNLVQPSGTALQFNGPLVHHPDLDQHLPLKHITAQNSNHLIGMIHFRTEGLLENEAAQVLSFSWE